MTKLKIQIKNRWTGSVLFEYEKEDNTIKQTLLEAVKSNANLSNADLRNADLRSVNLSNADLRNADLRSVNLSGADLSGVSLCNADLCNANLCNANLSNADLRNADLRNVNLSGADLSGADLRGVNLSGVNLRGANLSNADLRGSVIGYNDNEDGYGGTSKLVDNLKRNTNLTNLKTYENHDTFSSRCGCFWRNLIIIREWELKESKPETIEWNGKKYVKEEFEKAIARLSEVAE